MNGTIEVWHQTLVSKFKYFESSSLLCNSYHSLYFCSITVIEATARVVGSNFSGALSVDFHPIHVDTNKLLFRSVIDSIINLVLAAPSYSRVARPSHFHVGPVMRYVTGFARRGLIRAIINI